MRTTIHIPDKSALTNVSVLSGDHCTIYTDLLRNASFFCFFKVLHPIEMRLFFFLTDRTEKLVSTSTLLKPLHTFLTDSLRTNGRKRLGRKKTQFFLSLYAQTCSFHPKLYSHTRSLHFTSLERNEKRRKKSAKFQVIH